MDWSANPDGVWLSIYFYTLYCLSFFRCGCEKLKSMTANGLEHQKTYLMVQRRCKILQAMISTHAHIPFWYAKEETFLRCKRVQGTARALETVSISSRLGALDPPGGPHLWTRRLFQTNKPLHVNSERIPRIQKGRMAMLASTNGRMECPDGISTLETGEVSER